MTKWIILSQRYTRDSRIIQFTAKELGYKIYRIRGSSLPDWIKHCEILVYCEGFMAEFVSQETGVAILRPLMNSLSLVPYHYLQRRIQFKTVEEMQDFTKPTFIKPADQKFFCAGVYDSLSQINGFEQCPGNDPVFISEVVEFVDEFRLFCYDGQVQTSSQYVQSNVFIGDNEIIPDTPAEIIEFGNQVLKSSASFLPPGVVVDVGFLRNGKIALIEFNPAWASGVYGVDPVKALECISRSCIQREKMTSHLKKYEIF